MINIIKLSAIAATLVLVTTGCTTKEELKAVSDTQFFYTTHHCPVHSGDSVCPMPKVQAPVVVDGDEDGDGVLDSMDKCLGTIPYAKVDASGCAIVDGDDDKDGVLNSVDKCPETPAGAKVDASGCKVVVPVVDGDSDKDGVKDSMDKCPATNSNVTKVDADGCASEVRLNVNFELNSANVQENSLADILSFGYFMNEHTSYKATIEGHTDSFGATSYNQVLSQKRAQAVTDLIVSKGNVDASRLEAIGKGESSPVIDNATKANRAANRRTEAHIIK